MRSGGQGHGTHRRAAVPLWSPQDEASGRGLVAQIRERGEGGWTWLIADIRRRGGTATLDGDDATPEGRTRRVTALTFEAIEGAPPPDHWTC